MFKKLFFIIGSVFVVNHLHADTTYVFCATKERKWDWLKENGNYVTVSGEWKYGLLESAWFQYFKLTDDTQVEDLQRKCKNLDEKYVHAQPANSKADDWHVFAHGRGLASGFNTYCNDDVYQVLLCRVSEHLE